MFMMVIDLAFKIGHFCRVAYNNQTPMETENF